MRYIDNVSYNDPEFVSLRQNKIEILHDMWVVVDVLAAKGFLEQAFKECREGVAIAEEVAKTDPP